MKFLVDENIPSSFSNELKTTGYEVRHVTEVGLKATDDNEIVSFARKSGEIIITYDLDFSRIISLLSYDSPSLITLRVSVLNSESFLKIINEVLKSCRRDLETGAMISVDDDRMRIRMLPVIKKKKK